MADKDKAVEATGGDAAATTTEVKKDGETASTTQEGLDLATTLEKTLEQLARTEKDRDNYKAGLLKAKGKTDEGADLSDDERVRAMIAEALEAKERDAASKQAEEDTKKLITRVRELETALKAKDQMNTTGTGTSTETKVTVGDNALSDAQVNDLKARGWDDAKIARFKENLKKVRA